MDDCDKGTGGPRCPEKDEGDSHGSSGEDNGGDGNGSGGDGDGDGGEDGDGNGSGGDGEDGDGNGSTGDGEDGENGDGGEDGDSSSDLVACDGEIDSDAEEIVVTWFFTVESSSDDPSNVAEKVCGAMSNAVVGAFNNGCAYSTRQRRLNEQRRRLEIQGYSDKVKCNCDASGCTPKNPASGSCAVCEAEMTIAYDDEGDDATAEEVTETVTTVAEDTLTGDGSDDIDATVNDELDDSDDTLTSIGYGDPDDPDDSGPSSIVGEEYRDTEGQGLSRAGKMAIAFMSVLILLLLLLCIVCWRRRSNRETDSKSIGTDGTDLSPGRKGLFGGSRGSNSLSDDESYNTYLTSDFNNLGLHHSKLDVHKCASASCEQCNPIVRENERGVFFVNSREQGTPLSDIVEEECRSSSDYKSSIVSIVKDNGIDDADDDDDDESEVPPPPPPLPPSPETKSGEAKRKSFFSQFRRSMSRQSESPTVHTEDSANDAAGDIEVEI